MTSHDDIKTVRISFGVDMHRIREAGIDLDSAMKQRLKDLLLDALEFYVDCRSKALEFYEDAPLKKREGYDTQVQRVLKDALVWSSS
jgi:hypothetical protein